MKWEETTASKCRYGDIAEEIWGDWNILWEDSYDDYQGYAKIFAQKGKKYCFYEWTYGSCSGCDSWEGTGIDVKDEMQKTAMWFSGKKSANKWLKSCGYPLIK